MKLEINWFQTIKGIACIELLLDAEPKLKDKHPKFIEEISAMSNMLKAELESMDELPESTGLKSN